MTHPLNPPQLMVLTLLRIVVPAVPKAFESVMTVLFGEGLASPIATITMQIAYPVLLSYTTRTAALDTESCKLQPVPTDVR
jgi:hypothetical protein